MTVNESCFPRLATDGYQVTSEPTAEQNCIGHAADRPGEWWDPAEDQVWPDSVPRDYSVDAIVAVFVTLGYTLCKSAAHEVRYEKVAIYSDDDEYTHAARQLADGSWTSKLGPDDDINHPTLESLAGGLYGNVVRVMKRARSADVTDESKPGKRESFHSNKIPLPFDKAVEGLLRVKTKKRPKPKPKKKPGQK